jgi:hypothetical protein
MASAIYPKVYEHLLRGDVDLDTATIKVLLIGGAGAYTYDVNDEFVSDLSGELADGVGGVAGYSRKTVSVTTSFDADVAGSGAAAGVFINFDLTGDAEWTSATFTARHAVMFIDAGGLDSANKLLYYFDLGADQIVSSGTFKLLDPNPQPKLRRG